LSCASISQLFLLFLGTTQGIAMIENLMEHLAKVLKEDPLEFRIKNMNPSNDDVGSLKNIIEQLRRSSDYDDRLRQVMIFFYSSPLM